MSGKRKKRNENARISDEDTSSSRISVKKDMKTSLREFYRTQRSLISLVETGEITTENSTEIIESLEII